jgi:hypothetical protein
LTASIFNGLALADFVTRKPTGGLLRITPSLLLGTVSPSAPVVTLALIGAEVVGVPLIVQTIAPPAGNDRTGDVGLQVLTKPGGKSVTIQNAFAAGTGLALMQVIVCPAG